MALIRCDKDLHFYDNVKHQQCPYCRVQEAPGDATEKLEPVSSTPGPGSTERYEPDADETVSVGVGGDMPTEPLSGGGYAPASSGLSPDALTQKVYDTKKTRFSPITGWLVCVDGPERGKDYRVKAGINLVGRGDTSDIVIKGDDTISREDHAEVEYDPKENRFYMQRKRNAEVYLNGSKIRQPQEIKAYDVLQFGESAFVFIPLCSEQFQWQVD